LTKPYLTDIVHLVVTVTHRELHIGDVMHVEIITETGSVRASGIAYRPAFDRARTSMRPGARIIGVNTFETEDSDPVVYDSLSKFREATKGEVETVNTSIAIFRYQLDEIDRLRGDMKRSVWFREDFRRSIG